MTDDERQKLVTYIENYIAEHGSISVMNAFSDVGVHYGGHDIEKFSLYMTRSGKYSRTISPTNRENYFIALNPNYELNQNMIDTNRSIQRMNDEILPANFQSQEKFGNRSLWLAGLSVLFIAATTFLQWKDTTSKELQLLQQQVQQTSKSLDSIRLYQKGIDSSMKIYLERLDTSLH